MKRKFTFFCALFYIMLILSCGHHRDCKNVKGLEFNENIIESYNPETYCFAQNKLNTPIVINDSITLKQYLCSDTRYPKLNIDFSSYSLIAYSYNFKCTGGKGVKFDLIINAGDDYKLIIYNCKKKSCLMTVKGSANYLFKTKKMNNNSFAYEIKN